MYWSAVLVLALVGPTSETMNVSMSGSSFDSYTQAWHAAKETERPMLVVLNPSKESGADKITEDHLRADASVDALLNDYVVAVIDTDTAHGRQVKDLFHANTLPRVIVIDKHQEKQVFKSSDDLSNRRIAQVLSNYKDGKPLTVSAPVQSTPLYNGSSAAMPWSAPPADCPSCQRNWAF